MRIYLNIFEKVAATILSAALNIGLAFLMSAPVLSTVSYVSAFYLNLLAFNRNGLDIYLSEPFDTRKSINFYVFTITFCFLAVTIIKFNFVVSLIYLVSIIVIVSLEKRKVSGNLGGYFILPVVLNGILIIYCVIFPPVILEDLTVIPYLIYFILIFYFASKIKAIRRNWYAILSIVFFWKEFILISTMSVVDQSLIGPFFLMLKLSSLPSNLLAVYDAKSLSLSRTSNWRGLTVLISNCRRIAIFSLFPSFIMICIFMFIDYNMGAFSELIKTNLPIFLFTCGCHFGSLYMGPVTFPFLILKPHLYGTFLGVILCLFVCYNLAFSLTIEALFVSSGLSLIILKIWCMYHIKSYIVIENDN